MCHFRNKCKLRCTIWKWQESVRHQWFNTVSAFCRDLNHHVSEPMNICCSTSLMNVYLGMKRCKCTSIIIMMNIIWELLFFSQWHTNVFLTHVFVFFFSSSFVPFKKNTAHIRAAERSQRQLRRSGRTHTQQIKVWGFVRSKIRLWKWDRGLADSALSLRIGLMQLCH